MRRTFTLLLVVLISVAAEAQTTTATVRGTVRDTAGAPVAGAEVNAIATATARLSRFGHGQGRPFSTRSVDGR